MPESAIQYRTFTFQSLLLVLVASLMPFSESASSQDVLAEAPENNQPIAKGSYTPWPSPDSGYVTDHANLLSKEQHEKIEQWLYKAEKEQGVEIIVVTVASMQSYTGTPRTIEQFATGLFNRWGIGDRDRNNGVLILVSPGDRKARIELGAGYRRTRDADSQAIMKSMVAEFKSGDYQDGITTGVKSVLLEFANVRIGWNWPLIIVLALIPISGCVAYSLFKNGKKGWGWVVVGLIGVLIFFAFRMMQTALENTGNSDSWGSGGFGGGFGGGSSGGGGATGSW